MSWQDELRLLDEELAAGRLAAEDYRRQRDELLSRAAATAAGPPPTDRPAGPSTPSGGSPFPPPFRWQPSGSESTQIIPPIRDEPGVPDEPGSADTTQVVRNEGKAAEPEADRTQVVAGGPGVHPTGVHPAAPPAQHGWPPPDPGEPTGHPAEHPVPSWPQQVGPGPSAPPWAGSDPVALEPTWLRQGPEVFETGGRSGAWKALAAVAVVVLVVLLGAGAIYLFGFRGASPPSAEPSSPPSSTTATPTTTTIPKPAGPFVDIDGEIVLNTTMTIDEATKANRPAKGEMETLRAGGTQDVAVFLTELEDLRRGIWTFRTGSPDEARRLLQAIDDRYVSARYQELPGAGRDVLARFLPPADPNGLIAYRAHYVRDYSVVRVEAYGKDPAVVERQFRELLGRQLDDFPPR